MLTVNYLYCDVCFTLICWQYAGIEEECYMIYLLMMVIMCGLSDAQLIGSEMYEHLTCNTLLTRSVPCRFCCVRHDIAVYLGGH